MEILSASYLLPISAPPIEGGAIAFNNGVIEAVGTLKDIKRQFTAPIREYPGAVIMPGLVNAHAHLELTNFAKWCTDKGITETPSNYIEWILKVIKCKKALTEEDYSSAIKTGAELLIKSGTTSVGDILSCCNVLGVYENLKLSGRIYLELIGHDKEACKNGLEAAINKTKKITCRFLAGLSPHTPFTLSPEYLREIDIAAEELSLPLTMHIAESYEESAFFENSIGGIAEILYPLAGWGAYLPMPQKTTPVKFLENKGLIKEGLLAVHAVHLDREDALILKKHKNSIVLCPRSNEKLKVGKAPVKLFKELDIPLALGTDSLASNDSLSLWDEMRYFMDSYTGFFSPSEILKIGTLGGAKAIQTEKETGTLEKGKSADILVVEPAQTPKNGSVEEQLLEGEIVCSVWVKGVEAM